MERTQRKKYLKKLARDDRIDDYTIANIRRRKLIRSIQRQVIEEDQSRGGLSLHEITFMSTLKYFSTHLRLRGPHVLRCAACEDFPDDPKLTQCAHLYCEECFSEMKLAAEIYEGGGDAFLVCESANCMENVAGAIPLTSDQWRTLVKLQHTSDEDMMQEHGYNQERAVACSIPTTKKTPNGSRLEGVSFLPGILGDASDSNNFQRPTKSEIIDGESDEEIEDDFSDDGFDNDDRSLDYENDAGSDAETDFELHMDPDAEYNFDLDAQHDEDTASSSVDDDSIIQTADQYELHDDTISQNEIDVLVEDRDVYMNMD